MTAAPSFTPVTINVDNGTLALVPGIATRAVVRIVGNCATAVARIGTTMQPPLETGAAVEFCGAIWVLNAVSHQADAQTLTYTFHRRPNP